MPPTQTYEVTIVKQTRVRSTCHQLALEEGLRQTGKENVRSMSVERVGR